MALSSLVFIFIFLPLSLLLYHLVPQRGRQILLAILSLLFYAFGSPKYLAVLLLSIAFNYGTGIEIEKWGVAGNFFLKRFAMIFGVTVNIVLLGLFKYSSLGLPIGISFFTFSAISYLLDVYWEKAGAEYDPVQLILYIAFFPKVTSGPIVQYRDFKEQLRTRTTAAFDLREGMSLFLYGLFKKVILADTLGKAFGEVTALSSMAGGSAWLGMIFYSLQLYFDFDGYSDMAIGLSRMFGFRFEKNFDYPYLSTGISEFWRRWHISLGAWFRNYVYIPLGGNRCSVLKQIRNLMIVWALTGIWHGSTLNFLVWGLYHGLFVLLERFVLKDALEKIPDGIRVFLTDFIAFFGWIFFFSPSLMGAFRYIGRMFGMDGVGFWNGTTTFILKEYALILILSVLFCGPVMKNLHDKLAYVRGGAWKTASVVLHGLLFLLCVAGLVSATYTSFLYFRF